MKITTQSIFALIRRSLLSEFFLAPALLLAISLVVFRGQFSGASYAIYPDNTYMYLPLFAHAARVLTSGEYPYWINTIVGGLPLFDTPQFTVDYPFYFLHANLYRSALSALITVHLITLLHYYILLLNSYILFRVLGISILAALTGATFFAFSANMVSYFFGVTMLAPYSWLPLFIAALSIALRGTEFFRPFFLGVFSLAMMVLSAPSLPFIHCCFISAVILLFFAISCLLSQRLIQLRRALTTIGAIGLATFAIVCPYLIAELQSMPGFIRWIGASALIGKAQMPFEAFLLGQMAPIHAFDVIFPFSGSHLIGNAFIGWGGVFLILLSLNRLKQTPILQPLLFLMIWGFLSAFGSNFGLAYINYHIPFLNLMREPGRHLFIFIFSASVLLTHGLDYLVTNRKESLRFFLTRYNLTAFCVLCLITILGPLLFSVKAPAAYIGITALIAAAFPVYLLCRSPRTRMLVLVALSAAMISTGLSYFNFIRIPITEGDYFDRWNLTSHNVLRDLSGIEGIKDYRVIFQEPGKDQYWSMNGSYYGIRSFNAYFNPLPHEQFSQIFYHGHRYDNYRELLGAKYVVCKTCDASSLKAYTLEQELHGYNIFRTDNVLPRYKVFNILESTYQNSTQFYQHLASGYDFVNRLQIRESDAAKLKEHLVSNAGEVTPCVLKEERSSFNSLTLSASCDSPGVLVLNEYFNSNWKARINSNDAELFRVNLNQIGIPLGKGASFVEIEYRPRLFSLLRCFSSAVAWGLLVAFLLTLAVRRGWISRS